MKCKIIRMGKCKSVLCMILTMTLLLSTTGKAFSETLDAAMNSQYTYGLATTSNADRGKGRDEYIPSEDDMDEDLATPSDADLATPSDADLATPSDADLATPSDADTDLDTEPDEDLATPSDADLLAPVMIPPPILPLGADEAIVTNYKELNDALSKANGITKIYFGDDIVMEKGGISINTSKTELEIFGINPFDEEQAEPYTLTDYNSNSAGVAGTTITINMSSSSKLKNFNITDLDIVGYNVYGPFAVYDTHSSNLTIRYERVTYIGPQFIYHRSGTSQVVDCNINITGRNQEFGEIGSIKFEGENYIESNTSATNAVFWMHASGGSFIIEDNSSLHLKAINYSKNRGIFYGSHVVAFKIGKYATFDIQTSAPFTYSHDCHFKSFDVLEGGTFRMETTAAYGVDYAAMNIGGDVCDLNIGQGATFWLIVDSNKSSPALMLRYGATLRADNPESVLIFNKGKLAVRPYANSCNLVINAQQINLWKEANNGKLDNVPNYHWCNLKENISLTAKLEKSAKISSCKPDYDADPGTTKPTNATLDLSSVCVLSFGSLELSVDHMLQQSERVEGMTAPGAEVRTSYKQEDGSSVHSDGIARDDGSYAISLEGAELPTGTKVTVQSAIRFLRREVSVTSGAASTVTVQYCGMDQGLLSIQPEPGHIIVGTGESFTYDIVHVIEDYKAMYYTLYKDGELTRYDIQEGSPGTISITEIEDDVAVTVYYVCTLLDVSIPSSVEFFVTMDTGGEVVPNSSNGKAKGIFSNQSELPVKVSFLKMEVDNEKTSEEIKVVEHVTNPATYNQLQLNIVPAAALNNSFTAGVPNIIPDIDYQIPQVLGTLGGVYYTSSDNIGEGESLIQLDNGGDGDGGVGIFEISGNYAGAYPSDDFRYNVEVHYIFDLELLGV